MEIRVEVTSSELVFNPEDFRFNDLNPIQKLDAVLATLELSSKTINEIQKILRLKLEPSTFYEVRIIVNKLLKDGYAEEIKAKIPPPVFADSHESHYFY